MFRKFPRRLLTKLQKSFLGGVPRSFPRGTYFLKRLEKSPLFNNTEFLFRVINQRGQFVGTI